MDGGRPLADQKEDLFRRALLRYDRVHRPKWFAGRGDRFDLQQFFEHQLDLARERAELATEVDTMLET